MLVELATQSHAQAWAVGSMLFFVGVFAIVVVRVVTRKADAYSDHAGLPLNEAPAASPATHGEEV